MIMEEDEEESDLMRLDKVNLDELDEHKPIVYSENPQQVVTHVSSPDLTADE
jgi:hypothetical protein